MNDTQAERTWLDRVYSALPLATIFIWLVALYAWQSWHHTSPWLFTDELELTQLARSIADTGEAARRGEPHFFESLYTYVTAPAWWIGSTAQAYDVVRYLGVFMMTAVVFPAYFLARTVVRPPAALFAAAATAAVPALAYSQMIVEEALAYPYAALCFFLIANAIAHRTRGWIAGAVVASLVAPLVRGELAVIPVVFGLALFFYFLTSEAGTRWWKSWKAWDWIGAVVLTTGFLVFFSAAAGNFSQSWLIATGHYRGRMIEYGLWAAGAFTIGLGVLPVVAALAGLARPKDEPRTPALRAFTALFAASLVTFGLYTAVKASYLSTAYGTVIVERNLIYLVPLVMVGTALWLERPRLRWLPLAAAVGFVAYLLVTTPYALENVPYSDALGLAIAQMSNRNLAFTDDAVQWALIVTLVVAVCLLVAPRLLRGRPRLATGIVVATAVLVVSWTLTGQISAAKYSNDSGDLITRNFPKPLDVARRDHRRRARALSRPEHRARGRARHLADGVLEPLAEERLEPRRNGAPVPAPCSLPTSSPWTGASRPTRERATSSSSPAPTWTGRSSRGHRRRAAGRSIASTARSGSHTRRPASSPTAGWVPRAPTTSTRRRTGNAATSSSRSHGRPGAGRTSRAAC